MLVKIIVLFTWINERTEFEMENKIATLIRIDEELYEDIKYLATKYNRSINKQIEYMLKLQVEQEGTDTN